MRPKSNLIQFVIPYCDWIQLRDRDCVNPGPKPRPGCRGHYDLSMYVYYCRTYEKAVSGGGERETSSTFLQRDMGGRVQKWR